MAKSGFTLIELVLVVVLLSVVVSVSLPSFRQSYKKLLLERTTNDIAYLMRYAQSRAITKGQEITFVFDGNFSNYGLEEMVAEEKTTGSGAGNEPKKKSTEKKSVPVSNRWGRKFLTPPELTVRTESSSPIRFYPDGKIDRMTMYVCYVQTCQDGNTAGSNLSIDEKSCADQCMTISTKYQRGAVQVFDETLEEKSKKTETSTAF